MMKNFNKIPYIFSFFFFVLTTAQTSGIDYSGLNITTPTASSISNNVRSPISLSTGVPDINIPLCVLSTHEKIGLNLTLNYNPNNTFIDNKSSDVGLGWSLNGLNAFIYREVNKTNGFPTDKYYFNIFGIMGKFRLNGTSIVKETVNKLSITATEIGGGKYNFLIKDESGHSYYFQNLDTSYYLNPIGTYQTNINFTGCYYLTKIENSEGDVLLTCSYIEDNYTVKKFAYSSFPDQIPVKSLKLHKITSTDFGSITCNYSFDSNKRKSNMDAYQLDSLELKTTEGKIVQKYIFEYDNFSAVVPLGYQVNPVAPCGVNIIQSKRRLLKIKQVDPNNEFLTINIKYPISPLLFEGYWTEYPFEADPWKYCFKEEFKNPKYLGLGLLSSISYSNGTEVKYTFEPNRYYVNKNTSEYLNEYAPPYSLKDRDAQYFEDVGIFHFDFHSPNPGVSILLFNLSSNPDETDGASYLWYHLVVEEYYTDSPILPENPEYNIVITSDSGVNGQNGYKKFMPGFNSMQVKGTGGRGAVIVKRVRYKSKPLPNYATGKGVRIKKIEYYNGSVLLDSQTKVFNYQRFDDNTNTSGFLNNFEHDKSVVYKNVKETTGINKGYVKSYFKTLDDEITNASVIDSLNFHADPPMTIDSTYLNNSDLKFVNIFRNGLLYKRETFNNANELVTRDSSSFAFHTLPVPYSIDYDNLYDIYSNEYSIVTEISGFSGLIKEQTNISTLYNASGAFTQTSEITWDVNDYNVTYKKNTGTDGNITEEFITYPYQYQSTSPKLWNAHIKDVPMVRETKVNGVTVSKSETKFEDPNHYYPTSQVSYLPDNPTQAITNVSYDIYDDKGNLVQFTALPDVGGVGKPTTVIWGYHKTMPIAKIEGAKLSDIPTSLITVIVNASNADADALTPAQETSAESALVDQLNLFRTDAALKDYMISCYTYNPLIGVTKMIPPTGMMEIYNYDSFNRLMNVKDVNGKVLKEYEYHYKQ